MENYSEHLRHIVDEARRLNLGLKDVYAGLEKDARRGLLFTTFYSNDPRLQIVIDNIDTLKSMGFKIYIPKHRFEWETDGIYLNVSWAKEGELDNGSMQEI